MHRFTYLLLILLACKKTDNLPPSVQITSPSTPNANFEYNQPIPIQFSVSDNNELRSYSIIIYDQNRNIVLNNATAAISGKSQNINTSIDLNDKYMASGTYSLEIIAEDEAGNVGFDYLPFNYFELPLQRKALLISRNTNGTQLDSLANGVVYPALSAASPHAMIFAGSRFGEIIVGGNTNPYLDFWSFPELEPLNLFFAQNPLNDQYVQHIVFHPTRKTYLVAVSDGRVLEFQKEGNLLASRNIEVGYFPEKVFPHDKDMICVLRNTNLGNRILARYNLPSGSLAASASLNFEVIELIQNGTDTYIVGNQNGSGVIKFLSENLQTSNYPFFNPIEEFHYALSLTNGWLAMASTSGITQHRLGTSIFLSGSLNGVNAIDMSFDPANALLFALSADGRVHSVNLNS
ncbi:MAG: hypothetical protein RL226_843, partial [Bacteroidota bacterium]